MTAPKVSVVIPTYNRAHLIGIALRSVLLQTYSDYEIVVVDDGSTDDTESIVRTTAPKARYIRQENQGIPEVLNSCIRLARGEYIALLGSDDALAPDALARQAAALEASPGVGFVHGTAWLMDEAGRLTKLSRPQFATGNYVRGGREEIADLLLSNHVVATTVMVRRRALDECGTFDARFGLYEDWNLWMRILKRWDVAYEHEPLAFYRVHRGEAGSIFRTADPRALERFRRLQIEEALGDPEVGPSVAHRRSAAYARHHYVVAMHAFGVGARWFGRRHAAVASVRWGNLRAGWLLARSFVPGSAIGLARRILKRDRQATSQTGVWPSGNGTGKTLDAVLAQAGVSEA
jgi:glycosyltransferase involved in cell wall biosynthesis